MNAVTESIATGVLGEYVKAPEVELDPEDDVDELLETVVEFVDVEDPVELEEKFVEVDELVETEVDVELPEVAVVQLVLVVDVLALPAVDG